MADDFNNNTIAFLDDSTHVVPPHACKLLSALPDASLNALASAATSELTGATTTEHHDNEAFAAMCVLITSVAKNGCERTPAEQRQQLFDLGIEDNNLQTKLMSVLATVVPSVEQVLEHTYFDFAHIVDVNWRLDYVLRSSSAGSIHEPLYFVQLRLQPPCTSDLRLRTMVFSCTVEELRSLVYRIQEATNEVEKLAAGTTSRFQ
ncbi:putative COMM domain-containing protein [Plasmopara halstedii]